jgi:hypothetical protein
MDLDSYVASPSPNKNYHLDESATNSFFLNGFKKPNSSGSPHLHQYILNSDGFRSDEFEKNADILFSGCSFTFGAGIPLEYLWSKIVADRFGWKHQNLGVPGSSTMTVVSNLFEYFRIYGNPKILVCLFPDPYRVFRIKNYNYGFSDFDPERKQLLSQGDSYLFNEKNYFENVQRFNKNMDGPKIIKLPTEIENIIQPDTSYYLSMMSINILEQYCLSNDIKFIWSSWEGNHMNSLRLIHSKNIKRFPGLIDIESGRWDIDYKKEIEYYYDIFPQENRIPIKCHQDLFDKSPDIFHLGFDTEYGAENAHWGSHRNLHVAEKFIAAIYNSLDL